MKRLIMLFAVVMLLVPGGSVMAFDPLFETTVHIPAADGIYAMELVDLDNDADLDIILLGDYNWVKFLANDGEGEYARIDSVQVNLSVRSMSLGDLDGDLDLDLVLGSTWDSIYVLTNMGGWSFQEDTVISTGSNEYVFDVKVENIDQDSDLDIVYAYRGAVGVMRNYGAGDFGSIREYASTNAERLALADYDYDGDVDIVVCNSYSDNFVLMENDNDTTFLAPVTYSITHPYDIVATELTGDDYPDLIVVNYGQANTYFNDGDGTFTLDSTYSMFDGYPLEIAVGDLNDDAILDFAVANERMCVFMGVGGGVFEDARDYVCGYESNCVGIGDLDGDGDLDVAGGISTGTIGLLFNEGDGTFPEEPRLTTGVDPGSLCAADFDNDGNPDIVVTNTNDDNFGVYFGNGDMTFDAPVMYTTASYNYGVEAIDLDGDTWIDLVVADSALSVYMNDGDGTFGLPTPYHCEYIDYIESGQQVAFADVTANGHLDAIVAAYDYFHVLEGNGDGTFQTGVTHDIGYEPSTVAIADIDHSGTLDVVLGDYGDYYVFVVLNDGDGTFGTTVELECYDYPFVVTVGDFDGDGWDDIASGDGEGCLAIFINNGDSTFQMTEFESILYDDIQSIVCYDFDKDGDLDLLPVSKYRNAVSFFENNGSGSFAYVADYGVDEYPYDIALADFDGDTYTDVAAVNYNANTISLLKNTYQAPVNVDDDDETGLPRTFVLAQNYPNPFNPGTTIEYDLPRRADVTLTIYNILGREVRTLLNEPQAAGPQTAHWNGRDNVGRAVASGVYLYHLKAGDAVESRKMILLK